MVARFIKYFVKKSSSCLNIKYNVYICIIVRLDFNHTITTKHPSNGVFSCDDVSNTFRLVVYLHT
jgi:hypothetical protein